MTSLGTRRPSTPRRPGAPATARARSASSKTAATTKQSRSKQPASKQSASTRAGGNAEQAQHDAQGALSYYLIAGSSVLLVIIGVTMVFSASIIDSMHGNEGNPYLGGQRQIIFAIAGIVLGAIASRLPVALYRKLAWPAVIAGLALQAAVYTPYGVYGGGNRNSLWIPGVNQIIQPAEFLKLGLALFLGLVLARKAHQLHDWRHVLVPGALMAGVAALFVVLGGDLGTMLVVVTLTVGAYFVAGLPMRWFAAAGVLGSGALAFLLIAAPYRMDRIRFFLGMEDDPEVIARLGYQVTHGLRALGTGGVSGVGLGASREKWAYLPEAETDYILAIIGEELGLLGTLVVILLFAALAVGLFRVIRRHRDPFVQIATGGIAAWILGQALINIGVVVNLLPVIGVPLPLVSAGGSSLLATLLALGIVLAFARDEPGARRAATSRPSVVARSLAVMGQGRRG